MAFFFKRRNGPPLHAIEPVENAFPVLRDAELGALYAGERAAGDFFDSIRVSPTRVLFGLLDVAGRRAENEQILADAQQVFRELGTELFAPPEVNESDALTELCLQLNRTIMETAGGVRSCPAFAACYNEDLGIVCYINAGHTPGLVRNGTEISELSATGLPLGLFSHATSEALVIALQPGAALLLVSRGVVEAPCRDDEFGLDKVEAALLQAPITSAHDVCATILKNVQDFICGSPRQDDLTALSLIRHSAPPRMSSPSV